MKEQFIDEYHMEKVESSTAHGILIFMCDTTVYLYTILHKCEETS